MITRSNMFALLLEADPTFEPAYREFCDEWHHEPQPPLYLALGELATHLIAHLNAGTTTSFNSVFEVVERWQIEGDDYVREAAIVGLLEYLQNGNLHSSTKPADFGPWLRPQTAQSWADLIAFWGDKAVD